MDSFSTIPNHPVEDSNFATPDRSPAGTGGGVGIDTNIGLARVPIPSQPPETIGTGEIFRPTIIGPAIIGPVTGISESERDPGPEAPVAGAGEGDRDALAAEVNAVVGMPLDKVERLVIEANIRAFGGSLPKAARSLGVSPSTLYRKRAGWIDPLPDP